MDSRRILQINSSDYGGGAEMIARSLHRITEHRGITTRMLVGIKLGDDPHTLTLSRCAGGAWRSSWLHLRDILTPYAPTVRGVFRLRQILRFIAYPSAIFDYMRGRELFHFPETRRFLDALPDRPHLIHCHNLHGDYFDLRALPWLSRQLPMVVTMHDEWLMTGHCAHSIACPRWRTGCGSCPDLARYPAIRVDASAWNWTQKQALYRQSRLFLAAPSRWMMERVRESIVAPAIVESRVIHNGIDLSVFQPAEKAAVRTALGIDPRTTVLLFAANAIRKNPYKDFQTLHTVVERVAERMGQQRVLLLALGDTAPPEQIGNAEIRFIPFMHDPQAVARYYQAADLYLHAAHAEVWGLTVTEALACGTPVVATAVGGIPEQVEDQHTGLLTPAGDAEAMTNAVLNLLHDRERRQRFSEQAATTAAARFGEQRMVDDYLAWYDEILAQWRQDNPAACLPGDSNGL